MVQALFRNKRKFFLTTEEAKIYHAQYYRDNLIAIKKRKKEKAELAESKELRAKYNREYRAENIDRIKQKLRDYYDANKEKRRIYVEKNKEKIAEQSRLRYQRNKAAKNKYARDRRKKNEMAKMRHNLGTRLYHVFKRLGLNKPANTNILLGADPQTIKNHITNQFAKDMSWDNYGKWHIDHIIPLASAKDTDELVTLCHYLNLQPLWANENFSKHHKLNWVRNH